METSQQFVSVSWKEAPFDVLWSAAVVRKASWTKVSWRNQEEELPSDCVFCPGWRVTLSHDKPFAVLLATPITTEDQLWTAHQRSAQAVSLCEVALLEILQSTGQLRLFECGVLRAARHVDPLTIIVLGFVVLIVVPIVVDSVVVVNVVVLGRIGAVVPLIVV